MPMSCHHCSLETGLETIKMFIWWCSLYPQRCVERLKNSRSRLLEKFRQMGDDSGGSKRSLLVQEVMEEEWSALQSSNHGLPSLWNGNGIRDVCIVDRCIIWWICSSTKRFEIVIATCAFTQVYTAQQEFDELSAFEEIQQELIAQGYLFLSSCDGNALVKRCGGCVITFKIVSMCLLLQSSRF